MEELSSAGVPPVVVGASRPRPLSATVSIARTRTPRTASFRDDVTQNRGRAALQGRVNLKNEWPLGPVFHLKLDLESPSLLRYTRPSS